MPTMQYLPLHVSFLTEVDGFVMLICTFEL